MSMIFEENPKSFNERKVPKFMAKYPFNYNLKIKYAKYSNVIINSK